MGLWCSEYQLQVSMIQERIPHVSSISPVSRLRVREYRDREKVTSEVFKKRTIEIHDSLHLITNMTDTDLAATLMTYYRLKIIARFFKTLEPWIQYNYQLSFKLLRNFISVYTILQKGFFLQKYFFYFVFFCQ